MLLCISCVYLLSESWFFWGGRGQDTLKILMKFLTLNSKMSCFWGLSSQDNFFTYNLSLAISIELVQKVIKSLIWLHQDWDWVFLPLAWTQATAFWPVVNCANFLPSNEFFGCFPLLLCNFLLAITEEEWIKYGGRAFFISIQKGFRENNSKKKCGKRSKIKNVPWSLARANE